MLIRIQFLFIYFLIVINLVYSQSNQNENNINKRISIFGFGSPASASPSASPPAGLPTPTHSPAPQQILPQFSHPPAPQPIAVQPLQLQQAPAILSAPLPAVNAQSLDIGVSSNYPALPAYFTQDSKYQNNNDLLNILNIFTKKISVEAILNEFFHNTPTIETCVACNVLIKHLKSDYKNDEVGFKEFFFSVCQLFKINGDDNREFCTGLTDIYAPQLFYILENTKLNSEEICATLLTDCLDHYHWYQPPLFWEVQISQLGYKNSSKVKDYMSPRSTTENKKNEDENKSQTSRSSYETTAEYPVDYNGDLFEGAKFLHLSDIHLDLLYSLHSSSYCGRILCCRKELDYTAYPTSETKNSKLRFVEPNGAYYANAYSENGTQIQIESLKTQSGYWGSYGNCDLPLRTIKHMFKHLSSYIDQIDYIIFSGDSVSHNIWSTDKHQVIETNEILTKLIQKYLLTPTKNSNDAYQMRKFVPVVGNHESDVVSMFPSTSLKYSKFDINWLYEELYNQWQDFIPADQIENFKKGGYYSLLVAKNMKLIVLNTNACFRLNFWTLVFNQDLDDQLVWLEKELNIAESLNQNVHLVGHLVPDRQNCNAIWLHNFIQILTRYQAIIKAQFYGHSHLDEVKIYYGSSSYKSYNLRDVAEKMHGEHNQENIELLLNDIKNNKTKTKRTVNTLAEQQITQLINLESLLAQLQHINKDLIYKTKISLNDKINGYYKNTDPNYINEPKKPISIAFLSPSVTSYDDVNPAYKVFIIEDSGYVSNAKTFYADINEANRNHLENLYKPLSQIYPQKRDALLIEVGENYTDDTEISDISESENQMSYSYALPNTKLPNGYSAQNSNPTYSNPSSTYTPVSQQSKSKTGNYNNKGSSYLVQRPLKTSYQSAINKYNKQTINNKSKTKDYVESKVATSNHNAQNQIYNMKSSTNQQSTYDQSSKSSSNTKSYNLEKQLLYHPVYEKYSVQPQSLKKYKTNQNSYQTTGTNYQAYHLAGQNLSKLILENSKKTYDSQPKLNYSLNYLPKTYQQTYSKSNNYQHQLVPNYKKTYNEQNDSVNLPADIDYEYKHYLDANLYEENEKKIKIKTNYQSPDTSKQNHNGAIKTVYQTVPKAQNNHSKSLYYQQPATQQTYQQHVAQQTYQQPATQQTYQQHVAQQTYQQPAMQQTYQQPETQNKPTTSRTSNYTTLSDYQPSVQIQEYQNNLQQEYYKENVLSSPVEYRPIGNQSSNYKPKDYKSQKPALVYAEKLVQSYTEKPTLAYTQNPVPIYNGNLPGNNYSSPYLNYNPNKLVQKSYNPQQPQVYKVEKLPKSYSNYSVNNINTVNYTKPSTIYQLPQLQVEKYSPTPITYTQNLVASYKPPQQTYKVEKVPKAYSNYSTNYTNTVNVTKPSTNYQPQLLVEEAYTRQQRKYQYPEPARKIINKPVINNYPKTEEPNYQPKVSSKEKLKTLPPNYKSALDSNVNSKTGSPSYRPLVINDYSKTGKQYPTVPNNPINYKPADYTIPQQTYPQMPKLSYSKAKDDSPPVQPNYQIPVPNNPINYKPADYTIPQQTYPQMPKLSYSKVKDDSPPVQPNYQIPVPNNPINYKPGDYTIPQQTYPQMPKLSYSKAKDDSPPIQPNYQIPVPIQTSNQPADYQNQLMYEYQQYQLANEELSKANQINQPQTNGIIYENELGHRFSVEKDYKLMKMQKESKELKWRFEYDINNDYSIARSTPYDWVNFINLLRTEEALFEKYYRNLHRSSSAARWRINCNEICKQHLIDEIFVIDPLAY